MGTTNATSMPSAEIKSEDILATVLRDLFVEIKIQFLSLIVKVTEPVKHKNMEVLNFPTPNYPIMLDIARILNELILLSIFFANRLIHENY